MTMRWSRFHTGATPLTGTRVVQLAEARENMGETSVRDTDEISYKWPKGSVSRNLGSFP